MKKNGFTLIELLAVIIILGVLMIIAIPSVTKYINDSRKNGYISTAKNITNGARHLVNSGSVDLNDTNTTYYIDGRCISTDNGYKSPYGDFVKSYVVVTATNEGHEYYWTSVDDTGTGIYLKSVDKLEIDDVENNINSADITTNVGIDNGSRIVVINNNCEVEEESAAVTRIDSTDGEQIIVCKKATTLHTKTCERTADGCFLTVGTGNTLTYGTIPNGNIKPGDAYDCDVNYDKIYDSETERFYYVTNNGDNLVLIYYASMNDQATGPYDSSGENWHGPRDAYQSLPDKSEWKNPWLIAPGIRNILTDASTTATAGGTIEPFDYGNKAARLMTSQEIRAACPSWALRDCDFFLENVSHYERPGSGSYGYWLENPKSTLVDNIMRTYGPLHQIGYLTADYTTSNGVRPVIVIKSIDIEK